MRIDYQQKFSSGKSAFDNIAELQSKIGSSCDTDIDIHLIGAVRYGKAFIFLIGCLIVLGINFGKKLKIYLPTKRAYKHFISMGIVGYYREQKKNCRSFFRLDKSEDVVKLVEDNIKDAPIQMSDDLKELLVSLIGEVYNNAREHSEAKYVMGGCCKHRGGSGGTKRLCFFCYDTGMGIINSVKDYFGVMNDDKYNNYDVNKKLLKWALVKGNSTKKPPRGVGLDWLLSFAGLNKGKISICSSDVLFIQNPQGEQHFAKLQNNFEGTFFEMEIVEDSRYKYFLKGERA